MNLVDSFSHQGPYAMKPGSFSFGVLFGVLLLLTSCVPRHAHIRQVGDLVINDRQEWSGDVQITGVVHVTYEGQLILLPGTRLFFARIDRDHDGIGDGELLVEGEFQALGTRDKPILLTSAELSPQPADWKFLYFDYARKVDIAYLVSEYAYSGVQIHFCRAQIRNSEFRYNIDGVRFSTANIELAESYIHHNRHGIRFEERGGKGHVYHNLIRQNEIGIFAVVRCADKTLFEYNDFEQNAPYQVKMGLKQHQSLNFPRNWWGSATGLARETVFDQYNDPTLGQVTASEPLKRPVGLISVPKELSP
jgi:hypothetical protein